MSVAPRMGCLYAEHAMLGANFTRSHQTDFLAVSNYVGEEPFDPSGCALCDLTGFTYLLVSGDTSVDFAHLALAGPCLAVGELSFEAVLTGDGALAGAPLVMRCGDTEHVILDLSCRGAIVAAWLDFLAGIEANGQRPFATTTIEDATDKLVPLLLVGASAARVLADYLADGALLPVPGQVLSLALDAIPVVIGHELVSKTDVYVLLVPPARVRALWRSFLSFGMVAPIGHHALVQDILNHDARLALVDKQDVLRPTRAILCDLCLVRQASDFVGARALDG